MKSLSRMNHMSRFLSWLLLLSAALLASTAVMAAQVSVQDMNEEIQSFELTVGKSQIIRSNTRIGEIMIGNPDVADFKILTSQKVLILGKQAGRTNLVLRDRRGGVIGLFDLEVGYDTMGIKHKLHAVMPNEKGIEIRSSNNKVVMSGQASSLLAMDKALTLARSFVSNDKDIINLMGVGGAQQVMLEVRIAEVSRTAKRALGSEFTTTGQTGDVSILFDTGAAAANSFGSLTLAGGDVSLTLSALASRNLAKVLAEPNLVALSGHEASFLAGGEFPYQAIQEGAGATAVLTTSFKPFGVSIKFTPTVLDDQRISLKLAAESSDIDTNIIPGQSEPGISTRRAATTIELADGQGFAIAGLLQNNMNNLASKIPGLGDIPVLGALFSSTDFQRDETELVIVVVPRLVKAAPADSFALPTDNIVPPNQMDQYFFGRVEGGAQAGEAEAEEAGASESDKQKGLEGPYGHQL